MILNRINELMLKLWDPIGIGDVLGAEDEYAQYVNEIYEIIQNSNDHLELFEYLFELETKHIGLRGDKDKTRKFAHILFNEIRNSMSLEKSCCDIELHSNQMKIIACEARSNYILWVRFDDGIEGEVNLSDLVGQGVFQAWELEEFWQSVKIDPESETVCWGKDIDLDPYVLRENVLKQKKNSTSIEEPPHF